MRRRGEGCDYCGAPSARHRGLRATLCDGCLRPEAPPATDLLSVPNVRITTLQTASAVLDVVGPVTVERLETARLEVQRRMLQAPVEAVRVRATAPERLGLAWLDTAAGPLLIPAPGVPEGPFEEDLGPWLTWWELLPAHEPALGRALAALARDDHAACAHALREVPATEPRGQLLEAVRLVGQGRWLEALNLLERLEARAKGDLRAPVRYDLARLLLATGRARAAERLLAGLALEDAPDLFRHLDLETQRLGDCRLALQRLAAALEEHRAGTGDFPRRLQDLLPRHLTSLPTCAGRPYAYQRSGRGFRLRCRAGHPGRPEGWPRWVPRLGPLTRPEERPAGLPREARAASGPAEAICGRRGLWLSAAREGAGDVRGAWLALQGLTGREEALHAALLDLRQGREPDVPTLRAAVGPEAFRLQNAGLLEERVRAACAALGTQDAFLSRSGLFLALVRGGRADLCGHVRPPPLGPRQARLAWLCDAAVWCSGCEALAGPADDLLRLGLERAYDHVTPEATLLLELARVCTEGDQVWIAMLLARLYRQARRWGEAFSALEDAGRGGYPRAFVELEYCLLDLERCGSVEDLRTLLDTVEEHRDVPELHLELLARMLDAGATLDADRLHAHPDPQARMLGAWIQERQGDPEGAVARYRFLGQEFPGWPTAALFEAQALGRCEAAREALAARPDHVLLHALVLRLDPGDEASRRRLRELRPDLQDPDTLDLRTIDWPTPGWQR